MHAATVDKKQQAYDYYAFISYSSKNVNWARWLQNRLETYRLPAKTRKENAHLPSKISPIFRDETDLSGGVLLESLQKELQASQYLIVICSPESAASEWVGTEISYFASLGREKNIIPFIVDGEPDAADPARECFPAELRNMESELLGISVPELGRRPAFLRVVSTLLQLKYDQVVQRDRARRIRNGFLLGTAAAIAIAVLLWTVWYNMPHSKYYNAFVYQNEVPVGICEMSEQERSAASETYRITTQRGRVIRMECVNYLGTTVDPLITTLFSEHPDMTFQYDDSGRLISVEQSDTTGMVVSRKVLTYNDATNQIAIDFRQPSNNLQVQALSSDISIRAASNTDIGSKSEITRQVGTYDENGRLVTVMFQRDNLGNPACDSHGVYGKRYDYNALGQVIRISNLNENGEVHNCKYGWAIVEMTYNDMGDILTEKYYDADHQPARDINNCVSYLHTYDKYGNVLQVEHFDRQGNRCNISDGYSTIINTYNENGLLATVKYYNPAGEPAFALGIHEFRCEYDENGRCCYISYWGADAQPVYHSENRHAAFSRKWDGQGRILEEHSYDAQGNPIPEVVSGAYRFRFVYDKKGYLCEQHFEDAQGIPMTSKYGYASVIVTNDDAGHVLRCEYRDAQGNLTRNTNNIAIIEHTYDTFGNCTGYRYYDENGKPCYSADGYASVEYIYENGNMVSEKFFNADAQPMFSNEYYHECRMDYDDRGNRTRWSYYDTNGNLVMLQDNYAVLEQSYDAYGNVTEISYYNSDLQPVHVDGKYKILLEYDVRGNQIRKEYVTDSSEYIKYIVTTYAYDENDNVVSRKYYGKAGQLIQSDDTPAERRSTYNSNQNLIREEYLDDNGLPMNHKIADYENVVEQNFDIYGNVTEKKWIHRDRDGTETCIRQEVYTYDALGNRIRSDTFDGLGTPSCLTNTYATIIREYTTTGEVTQEEYYDENGEPCLYGKTAFRYAYEYDHAGNIIETRKYGTDGELLPESGGEPAYSRFEFDSLGNCIYATFYNENNELFNGSYSSAEYLYDAMGYRTEQTRYDAQGEIVAQYMYQAGISQVTEGGTGEAAGLQVGDFLIQYGSWNCFTSEADSLIHELREVFDTQVASEREVVVARRNKKKEFVIHHIVLPAGMPGIKYKNDYIKPSYVSQIQEAYETWLRTQA